MRDGIAQAARENAFYAAHKNQWWYRTLRPYVIRVRTLRHWMRDPRMRRRYSAWNVLLGIGDHPVTGWRYRFRSTLRRDQPEAN